MITCTCGKQYHISPHVQKYKCQCGTVLVDHYTPQLEDTGTSEYKVCVHRGGYVGEMECQCGPVFECNELRKLCGPRPPIDDAVMVEPVSGWNGERSAWELQRGRVGPLTAARFTCCDGCPVFLTDLPR